MNDRLETVVEEIKKLPPEKIDQVEKLLNTLVKRMIGIKEAAEIIGVSQETIRRAIRSGSLKAIQLNKMGTWRIPIEEIERFVKGKSS